MTQIRCPQEHCIFWLDGWCDAEEIDLDPSTLACVTFEEADYEAYRVHPEVEDDELHWDEDESLFEEELDESLYSLLDNEDTDEEGDFILADDDWH